MVEIVDERLVDLDLVDLERPEVRERRVAGAEVVDRDAEAEVARARAACRARSGSGPSAATRSARGSPSRGSSPLPRGRARSRCRRRPGSRSWRAERFTAIRRSRRAGSSRFQAASWRHAVSSTHAPIGDDQAGVLGDRDEVERRHRAEVRVVPPQQRLEADRRRPVRGRRRAGSAARARRARARCAGRVRGGLGERCGRASRRRRSRPRRGPLPSPGTSRCRRRGAATRPSSPRRRSPWPRRCSPTRRPRCRGLERCGEARPEVLRDRCGRPRDRRDGSRTTTNSSPPTRPIRLPGGVSVAESVGDRDEQLVAERVAVAVVHELEAVDVDEQQRRSRGRSRAGARASG